MPLYVYQCAACGKKEDHFRTIADRNRNPLHCDQPMPRVLTAPLVAPDLPAYLSPVTGKLVDGRRARREDLKRTGCRPYEDGERQEAIRRRASAEAALDAKIDASVEAAVEAMPVRKKEQLAAELASGADVAVARL